MSAARGAGGQAGASGAGPGQVAGAAAAVAAFVIWGGSPVYWKALSMVSAWQLAAHRIVWSFAVLAPLLLVPSCRREVRRVAADGSLLGLLACTAACVAANWGIYLWAVNSGRLLQASLGYYINPLVNVALGVAVLKERLRPAQAVAVGLAAAAVAWKTLHLGEFPWVSLGLAGTFGIYGLLRKQARVNALIGLGVESFLLCGPAVLFLAWCHHQGGGAFRAHGLGVDLLLAGAGPLTAVPLVLFAVGVKRLFLSTVGLMQYIAPTLMFALATAVYREPFDQAQLWMFSLVWAALALYSLDAVRHERRRRGAAGRQNTAA